MKIYTHTGDQGSTALFGGDNLNNDFRVGGSVTMGYWLDPCAQAGIEFRYLALGHETTTSRWSSEHYSVLARPYFDTNAMEQAAHVIASPELYSGEVGVELRTEYYNLEFLLRR